MSEGALKIENSVKFNEFLKNPPMVYHKKPELSFFTDFAPQDDLDQFVSQPYINEQQFT